MTEPTDRRARKRLATRRSISDVATRLFAERGFDAVTVDEIAQTADVGRKTVFNHFPRKEDLFFDRIEDIQEILSAAIEQRSPDISPTEALRRLAHQLVADNSYYVNFSALSRTWTDTLTGSETLLARLRAIRDETAQVLALALSQAVGRAPGDASAALAAGLILATWTVAFVQSRTAFRRDHDEQQAHATFLALIDQGTIGVRAAMSGTPYV